MCTWQREISTCQPPSNSTSLLWFQRGWPGTCLINGSLCPHTYGYSRLPCWSKHPGSCVIWSSHDFLLLLLLQLDKSLVSDIRPVSLSSFSFYVPWILTRLRCFFQVRCWLLAEMDNVPPIGGLVVTGSVWHQSASDCAGAWGVGKERGRKVTTYPFSLAPCHSQNWILIVDARHPWGARLSALKGCLSRMHSALFLCVCDLHES